MEKYLSLQARVFYKDVFAGFLEKTGDGYLFTYDKNFLKNNTPISMSLPLKEEPYYSKELFPFFKGLLPEGWYLDIVSMTQKVDAKNSFGILISTAVEDTIGAVTIQK
jgi:serine/threonine-protein kinase HipA